ncbi:MAG: Cas9 inhibitor AcrIIA9 family protein [Massilimicrobiota timonensis]
MEKFMNELKNTTNPWIKRIGEYLLSRDDMQDNLKKENKSLKECFDYILIELSKQSKREGNIGYAAGDDEIIYGMAVHYYDEDDIEVGKKNFATNADGSANNAKLVKKYSNKNALGSNKVTEDDGNIDQTKIDKAVADALEKYKKDEKAKKEEARRKRKDARQRKNDEQISIFDVLGDGK